MHPSGSGIRPIVILLPFMLATLAGCIPSYRDDRPAAPPAPAALPDHAGDLLLGDARVRAPDGSARWTPGNVTGRAVRVSERRVVAGPGDSLARIAAMNGAGLDAVARANGIDPPYQLVPGSSILIPGGLYHSVAGGETGIAIARAYGVAWGEVAMLNAITEPYILRVGQKLLLPREAREPETAVDLNAARRASAFRLDIDDIVTGSQPAIAPTGRPAIASAAPGTAATGAIATPARFTGQFRWPVAGAVVTRFGPLAPGKVNDGINIAATTGTHVAATADGVVSYAGTGIAVYGGLVLVSHGGGWVSAYGHLASIDVVRGQSVKAGTILGRSGASGQVQSPQLHFQLRRNRVPVDPIKHLPPR